MKKWVKPLLTVLILAGAGLLAWNFFFPAPEKAVRKRLLQVAEAASSERGEGNLSKIAKAQSLVSYFTQDVEIVVDLRGYQAGTISGRDELQQAILAARSRSAPLKVEVVDISVTVLPGGKSAEAHFAAKATFEGEGGITAHEMKARLVNVDGAWLIQRAETVRTLRD